jgi:hypothetical protein
LFACTFGTIPGLNTQKLQRRVSLLNVFALGKRRIFLLGLNNDSPLPIGFPADGRAISIAEGSNDEQNFYLLFAF